MTLWRVPQSQPQVLNLEIKQIGNKSDGMTLYHQDVTYVHITGTLISPGRTTFQRVNWRESGKPRTVSVTLRSYLQGVTWLARDLRRLPNLDLGP